MTPASLIFDATLGHLGDERRNVDEVAQVVDDNTAI